MQLIKFRVQNYKRIEESDWIELNQVTTFVGANESGKTTCLQALWKLKPARENILLSAQDEFPIRHLTTKYEQGGKWPVVTAIFDIDAETRAELVNLNAAFEVCEHVQCTNFYPDSKTGEHYPPDIRFIPEVTIPELNPSEVNSFIETTKEQILDATYDLDFIDEFSQRVASEEEQIGPIATPAVQVQIYKDNVADIADRYLGEIEKGTSLKEILNRFLRELRNASSTGWQQAVWSDETVHLNKLLQKAEIEQVLEKACDLVWKAIPVFIYFDDYNMLESRVYIPRAVREITSGAIDPKVRSQWALFERASFNVDEVSQLAFAGDPEQEVSDEDIIDRLFPQVQRRNILAKAAGSSITNEFANWWIENRHQIDFSIDGEFFQIWIADRNYPTPVPFEARSKGFRWFFTFYLIFTVETNFQHKNAVLLLDEPGLHLYKPQQDKLLELFDRLAENNQVIYTTHSPFMVDRHHLERVRFIEEITDGLARISPDLSSVTDNVNHPAQAAFFYHMARSLILPRRSLIVEGDTDRVLLRYLSDYLQMKGRSGLPANTLIEPAHGTEGVKPLVLLMLPQRFELIILLDNDTSGKSVGNKLASAGITENPLVELLYYGDILGQPEPYDLESMLPEDDYRQAVEETHKISLPEDLPLARKETFGMAVKKYCTDNEIKFDKGSAIRWLIESWQSGHAEVPNSLADNAEKIFAALTEAVERIVNLD